MHAFSTFLPHSVFFSSWQAYSFVTMNASWVRALNRNGWLYWRDLLCLFSPPCVSAFRMFCTFQHLGSIILAPVPLPVFVFALGLAQIWKSPAAFQLGFTSSCKFRMLCCIVLFCFVFRNTPNLQRNTSVIPSHTLLPCSWRRNGGIFCVCALINKLLYF